MAKNDTVRKRLENEREKLINTFVLRIFKGKAMGLSRAVALLKLKKFIRGNSKKWTVQLEELFDNTWKRQVPPEILEKFKPKEAVEPKIKPNKVAKESVEGPEKIKPNKRAYTKQAAYFKNSPDYEGPAEDDPEDLEDPKYDEPEFKLIPKDYNCANCNDRFTRDNSHTNRMLCPSCLVKLENSFNDSHSNFLYATHQELSSQRDAERNRILNIKTL